MENVNLIEIEQDALKLMNSGELEQAIERFLVIISENPEYEHGTAFYNIASCYEDLERFEEAERNYLRALEIDPENLYFLSGYASFSYLFKDPQVAFTWYLRLLKAESKAGAKEAMKETRLGLLGLAKKLRLSEEELEEKIKEILE